MSDLESARDEELVSTLAEQESRLANAHRIAREAIDLCELFVNRLTDMASAQLARGKAFGPSDGHFRRSGGVATLSGEEEGESSEAELSQGIQWEEAVLRIRAPQTAAPEDFPKCSEEAIGGDVEPGSSQVETGAKTDFCFGTPGSAVQCPVCLDDVTIVPPMGGRSDREAVTEVATLRCGHHIHLCCLLPCFLAIPEYSSRPRPSAFRCPVCRIPLSETLGALLRQCNSAHGGTRIQSGGVGRSSSVAGAFRRIAARDSLPAAEEDARVPRVRRTEGGTGTGIRHGNGTGTENGRPIGTTLRAVARQSMPGTGAAGLGRGRRNSGNGNQNGGVSISGSLLTSFQRPLQSSFGLEGAVLDSDVGPVSDFGPGSVSGSGSRSESDSDRETEGPRNRATALQAETELEAVLTSERVAQPGLRRLPRGSHEQLRRVSPSPTLAEAISASRERMEIRAHVRAHLARPGPSQEATRGDESAPAVDVAAMLRARRSAVLSTDPASRQQRQALLAANQPPGTSPGHDYANLNANPGADPVLQASIQHVHPDEMGTIGVPASERFAPPVVPNRPVIGNLLTHQELWVTLDRSTAGRMRGPGGSEPDINPGGANRGVLAPGAVDGAFTSGTVERRSNGTRDPRLSREDVNEGRQVVPDAQLPGFQRGLSANPPMLEEAPEEPTYRPSRLGFRGLWGRTHQWQRNVHGRPVGDGIEYERQQTNIGTVSKRRSSARDVFSRAAEAPTVELDFDS
ncbi:hypothetical protein KFL_000100240 [Klebsormidium nitens]|uniref:RING-type domain-containing protein n=1 Tax=Klebsormidium nitens TaxID=105231 RepID=A0A1Y1HR05_KLENI|nr:hypothetical protein KFL_000100240 [Klebsormidium nitens]|eukprot:GAQ78258.1 hypothetical protein KFL_000100240 [Klebsormidium nitens]